ncbi:hypothetical protein BTVI_25915 [Pitangus sulphuratus]|nr:hypothetical protein BTVI_25915 [Pitangus sulphuratus]
MQIQSLHLTRAFIFPWYHEEQSALVHSGFQPVVKISGFDPLTQEHEEIPGCTNPASGFEEWAAMSQSCSPTSQALFKTREPALCAGLVSALTVGVLDEVGMKQLGLDGVIQQESKKVLCYGSSNP